MVPPQLKTFIQIVSAYHLRWHKKFSAPHNSRNGQTKFNIEMLYGCINDEVSSIAHYMSIPFVKFRCNIKKTDNKIAFMTNAPYLARDKFCLDSKKVEHIF